MTEEKKQPEDVQEQNPETPQEMLAKAEAAAMALKIKKKKTMMIYSLAGALLLLFAAAFGAYMFYSAQQEKIRLEKEAEAKAELAQKAELAKKEAAKKAEEEKKKAALKAEEEKKKAEEAAKKAEEEKKKLDGPALAAAKAEEEKKLAEEKARQEKEEALKIEEERKVALKFRATFNGTITTLSGEAYENAKITGIDANGIDIAYSAGAKFIPFKNLPADLRKKVGGDLPVLVKKVPQVHKPTPAK